MSLPTTQYAQSGEASIAYQLVGEGPIDLMFLPGWVSQVEHVWEAPSLRRFLERLAEFSRLIIFDRRGAGLSDGLGVDYTLEQDLDDALAVLDAAGSERVALFSYGVGGALVAQLAADHPDRVGALIMYASIARASWAEDYDWALTVEEREEASERIIASRGENTSSPAMSLFAPSMAEDQVLSTWFAQLERLAASPGEVRIRARATSALDVRDCLPRISVPTLIMHRPKERMWDVRHSLYLAEHIPGARYVELEGIDSLPFVGDSEPIIEEVQEFLTGARGSGELSRALLTVMFTDIANATVRAGELGDSRWRDLLALHDEAVRKELVRYAGREVKTTGDGFLATFSGPPSSALRCAMAITAVARTLGIEVRVGLHTGECELIGSDVGGMAVHIASRVSSLAAPSEVLVSGTTCGTVVGGPFQFQERGVHELKGVPGHWPLFLLSG